MASAYADRASGGGPRPRRALQAALAAAEVLVYRRAVPDAPRFDGALKLGRGDVLESPLLPGFALPLAELFGDG